MWQATHKTKMVAAINNKNEKPSFGNDGSKNTTDNIGDDVDNDNYATDKSVSGSDRSGFSPARRNNKNIAEADVDTICPFAMVAPPT